MYHYFERVLVFSQIIWKIQYVRVSILLDHYSYRQEILIVIRIKKRWEKHQRTQTLFVFFYSGIFNFVPLILWLLSICCFVNLLSPCLDFQIHQTPHDFGLHNFHSNKTRTTCGWAKKPIYGNIFQRPANVKFFCLKHRTLIILRFVIIIDSESLKKTF